MVNEVLSAVSVALHNEFGDTHKIYVDNVEQALIRPCFFINVIRPTEKEMNLKRYYVSVPLVIQYFPTSQGKRMECYGVASSLFRCLKYPTFNGNTYRATDMKFDIQDDKLNFYLQYNFYTYKTDGTTPTTMNEVGVSVETNRKDDE